jgi:hypothetical protein
VGQAFVFNNNPVQKAPQIEAAQQAAQAEKLGIWGAVCAPPPPAARRTSQAPPPVQDDDADHVRRPAPAPAPAPAPKPEPAPAPRSNCHPSYQLCIPAGPDLDCHEIGHQVTVVGPDEYRLNADPEKDNTGCDSYPPA